MTPTERYHFEHYLLAGLGIWQSYPPDVYDRFDRMTYHCIGLQFMSIKQQLLCDQILAIAEERTMIAAGCLDSGLL